MDYLWTPWRYSYLTEPRSELGERAECVFCAAAACPDDEKALIVHRSQHNFVILNRFPYTSGHVMVVPYAHVATLEEMPEEALVEMMRLARDCEKVLRAAYRSRWIESGPEHRPERGRRRGGTHPPPRVAALDRRRELHDAHRGNARPARRSCSDVAEAARGLRPAAAGTYRIAFPPASGNARRSARARGRGRTSTPPAVRSRRRAEPQTVAMRGYCCAGHRGICALPRQAACDGERRNDHQNRPMSISRPSVALNHGAELPHPAPRTRCHWWQPRSS